MTTARSIRRLVRYARALTGKDTPLTAQHFEDDAWMSPLWFELVNHAELHLRLGGVEDLNRVVDNRGVFRWRLSPTSPVVLARLDRLVTRALQESCSSAELIVRRKDCPRVVKFRFLLRGRDHAHAGVLTFDGQQVEKALRSGGRRSGLPDPVVPASR